MKHMLPLCLLILFSQSIWASDNTMTMLWDRSPIAVAVKVNSEREIHFARENLKVFVPHPIRGKTRITTQNGVVFIYAFEPFKSTRVKVHDLDENIIFLLDVKGVKDGHQHPINVMESSTIKSQSEVIQKPIDYRVELIRYALQSLTGLPRLKEPLSRVQSKGVAKDLTVINRKGLFETAIAAYGAGPYRVDVIQVKNQTAIMQVLDPVKDIQGRWVSRSITQQQLQPMGSEADQSLLLLVSKPY